MTSELMSWLQPWYNKYAVLMLTVAAGLGLYHAIPWACLTASDWGTWVGSVGTVATLIGTVVLATESERRRKREQLALALIATAGLVSRLKNVQRALRLVHYKLNHPLGQPDDARTALKQWLDIVDIDDLWTPEELTPLVHVPGDAAARLAFIRHNIRSMLSSIQRKAERSEVSWTDIKLLSRTLSDRLLSSANDIELPYNQCVAFLVAHGFRTAWDGDEVHLPSVNS